MQIQRKTVKKQELGMLKILKDTRTMFARGGLRIQIKYVLSRRLVVHVSMMPLLMILRLPNSSKFVTHLHGVVLIVEEKASLVLITLHHINTTALIRYGT